VASVEYNRAQVVDRRLVEYLRGAAAVRREGDPAAPVRPLSRLSGAKLVELIESQMISRILDLVARELRARQQAYYTIGSSGHEGNVVTGDLVRHTDPAFLHYRSGGFMVQRARKVEGIDPVRDTLLGMTTSTEDPASGGRHKVWGSVALWVPPQTSTIASHLPKAVGTALSLERGHRLGLPVPAPSDAIVCCTFGDATVNHSTAQGALNSAAWVAHQRLPLPLLFVCEDNGWGISVPTPPGWIESSLATRHGLEYFHADTLDLPHAYETAARAVEICRAERRPVFLHLRVVRLLGHAGSDIELEYRSVGEVERTEAQDPLIAACDVAIRAGLAGPADLLERYEAIRARVRATAGEVVARPKLTSAAEVMAPLAPHHPAEVRAEAERAGPEPAGPGGKRAVGRQRHLAAMINRALREALEKYPEALVFGEDVARKGGVYHVTAGLLKEFGPGRVFNTLLDEQSILGLAIGAAHMGFLPIPEIQYLAYYHNAEDQLRGEACSLSFFSNAQFKNPMVVRIASFAYQKGFGGHFHNDNSLGALRDIPGLVLATPARGDDAVRMLRTCLALGRVDGRVVAFLEPIALYMTKDLHEPGDGLWLTDYPEQGEAIPLGEGRVYHEDATDLTIVSYANGLYRALRAARTLEAEHGLRARVLDLRWLAPLGVEQIEREARATGRLLVVDECRRAGGPGEAIVAAIAERAGGEVACAILAGADTYLPLGPAMETCLPDEAGIVAAAQRLVARSGRVRA